MEALAALSVASNVVQLIDFNGRLLTSTAQIYKSAHGQTDEIVDLELVSNDIQLLTDRLRNSCNLPRGNLSKTEKSILKVGSRTGEVSQNLLDVISRIRSSSRQAPRIYTSVLQAFRTILKDGEIKALKQRLEPLKSELILHLVSLSSDQQSAAHCLLEEHIRASKDARINNARQLESVKTSVLHEAAKHAAEVQRIQSEIRVHSGTSLAHAARQSQDLLEKVLAGIRSMQVACDEAKVCRRIIASLRYTEMPLRRVQIPATYRDTFCWIFDAAPFRPWLEESGGVFWINGKAGSGKSTLMKMLSGDQRTRTILEVWSADKILVQASFFFWASGHPMQKSQEGLLQSLLCQIFRQCPEVIRQACPERHIVQASAADSTALLESWSREDLLSTLQKVVELPKMNACFCFFIDGLDEYEGDHYDLVETFARLSDSSKVKFCVSSRPWNVFRKAYDGRSTHRLVLQDLNRDDINRYVKGSLEQDGRFRVLAAEDPNAVRLADEIRQMAQGVFLWVFLVVRSLLRGLTEEDDIEMLLLRLREIPDTLDGYFTKMLEGIEKFYRRYTARALLIALEAEDSLPLLSFHYLQLGIQTPGFAFQQRVEPLVGTVLKRKLETATANVNKWCRDLLEIISADDFYEDDIDTCGCQFDARGSGNVYNYQVTFLHRTVRDFLAEKDMYKLLWDSARTDFKPSLTLARIFLALAKTVRTSSHSVFDNVAASMMWYARKYEMNYGCNSRDLVLELDRVGCQLWLTCSGSYWTDARPRSDPHLDHDALSNPQGTWSILQDQSPTKRASGASASYARVATDKRTRRRSLLGYAIEHDLELFAEDWLREHPSQSTTSDVYPLLYHAARPMLPYALKHPSTGEPRYYGMIALLLRSGADPNERILGNESIWQCLLRLMLPTALHSLTLQTEDDGLTNQNSLATALTTEEDTLLRALRHYFDAWTKIAPDSEQTAAFAGGKWAVEILELMLHHGADPQAVRPAHARTLVSGLCSDCGHRFAATSRNDEAHQETPSVLVEVTPERDTRAVLPTSSAIARNSTSDANGGWPITIPMISSVFRFFKGAGREDSFVPG